MSAPIVVRFKFDSDELVETTREIYRVCYSTRFHLGMFISIAALGLIMLILNSGGAFPTFVFSVGLVGSYFIYSSHYSSLRAQVKSNENLYRREIEYQFSDEAVSCTSAKSIMRFMWNYFVSVSESQKYYYLCYGFGHYVSIPKRAFETSFDEAVFRELVSEKLGEICEFKNSGTQKLELETHSNRSNENPPDWR